jgi:hypothetical protein
MPLYIIALFFILFFQSFSFAQIKVYERPPDNTNDYKGIYSISSQRQKIDLNGLWSFSIDEGKSFNNINVPCAINYRGMLVFKKSFTLSKEQLNNFSFVLVAEGISYESDIFINNNFVDKSVFGFSSLISPIDENILSENNDISVTVSTNHSHSSSIPLPLQINYPKIYSGINRNIYLVAVPKIYVHYLSISYKQESETFYNLNCNATINSGILSDITKDGKDFSFKIKMYPKGSDELFAESNSMKVNIDELQNTVVNTTLSLRNPILWSTSTPALYIIKAQIYNSDNLIDESIIETGIREARFLVNKKGFLKASGDNLRISGINYYEESQYFGSALTYNEVEKDLTLIKEDGFNCIRIPGKTAHPVVISICNKIGLMVMEEIPFNEVPARIMKNPGYLKLGTEYLESIINRDKANPCIIAWGIGNDFDVTTEAAQSYVIASKDISTKLDSRPIYYTSRTMSDDICADLIDLKGLNLYIKDSSKIGLNINEIKKADPKTPIFISRYGYKIENENRSGYNDPFSNESQIKFLTEATNLIHKNFNISFVSSFADWNSERPLNFQLGNMNTLVTEGIYDFNRNPKQSATVLKKLFNNQNIPKLSEGNQVGYFSDKSFILIIAGVMGLLLFSYIFTKLPKFKEAVIKSNSMIFSPSSFFIYMKEQSLITNTYNFLLGFFTSLGTSIFFASLFYFYRDNQSWDMLLSNIISSDSFKNVIANNLNSPLSGIIIITIFLFFSLFINVFLLSILSLILKHKFNFKVFFSISVWSTYPFLIFLVIGTILYRVASFNSVFIDISLYIFIFFVILWLLRILGGIKFFFEYNELKAVIIGFVLIILTFGSPFIYGYFAKSTFSVISLILSYKVFY